VFEENFGVYACARSGGKLRREGHDVARCTVARLMRSLGLQGVIRGKPVRTTISDKTTPCPLDHVNRQFKAAPPECAVALRLHLRGDLGRLRLRAFIIGCVRPRRIVGLARVANGARGLRARRPGTGSA